VLKAYLIVPIVGTEQLNGFVIIGPPRNAQNNTYDHEEVRFIDNLTSQFAIATERSQVIESLEQRVRELDVLSQVGQAVNFTIEFDDLLELIYAQTSKLVDAPNFYIALYEERIDQMYFAFLLEDNERYNVREGIRQDLGDDLFSMVIKENNPRRVTNFQQETETRRASLDMVRNDLYAWMGVPLSAGRRKIGVMAAGKTRPGSEYTDEKFKIFRDIGALAATSLDKANLFNQTKMRERQLTVLNDISRQLVATESDVERLLEIIMNSAVEILNAEAGSLLLDTEDDTRDLEFRVVIGGAGEDLLGTRISRGKGIVGEVVETGEPIIVNNTADDPRHMQEVSDEFISKSLMAVPLKAKEGVIGVLEIINKKDGTPFLEEEAELLTTFAGQAAIAIENARLFQMTDRQLSQRVEELETLERIDSELNRTLDLAEVADITVRSTMDTLDADAGALGIVQKSPPRLQIVAIKGYKEADYPDGADGLYWPLDSGIVGRVMRSQQADIAMDVNQDPDYNSKLANSNSQITLPMVSGDEVNAILILEKNTQPRFSLPDWAFAQRIAEHASIAIANAQFYAALMQANESKSEFMGFVAHELKQPLTAVIGYADVLKGMSGDGESQQRNFAQVIHSNAQRMRTMISDLRDAARMESNQFSVDVEPMNIHHAIVETLQPFVRILEEKNQEIVNDVPEDLPLVIGDQKRLVQVLTNLVSNAHKYSPAETTIRIYARHIDNYTDKRGKKRGEMIQISVEDEGLGISEEDQKRLFKERYFRSTNKEAMDQPGTGLGMMLTQGIIEQHDGEIRVDSTLGEGSTFSFVIPVADEEKMRRDAGESTDEPQTEPASD
jgi:signal transduction histidine kinase